MDNLNEPVNTNGQADQSRQINQNAQISSGSSPQLKTALIAMSLAAAIAFIALIAFGVFLLKNNGNCCASNNNAESVQAVDTTNET